MAMNEGKTLFRIFTITDFEKEENFLREQHRKGYKLVKWIFPGFYHFEKCQPQDMIYRLEFNDAGNRDKSEYIQMYADFGWAYLFDVVGWSYFRKAAEETDGNEEIFSDNQSKVEHLQRVFRRRILQIIAIFLCCVIPQILQIANGNALTTGQKVFMGFWIVMFVLYIFILLHCLSGYVSLKKKYSL